MEKMYIKPQIEVIQMELEAAILAGSPGNPVYNDQLTIEDEGEA